MSDDLDEVEEITKQGKLMLTAMSIAAEEIKELAKETIIPYVEKRRILNSIQKSVYIGGLYEAKALFLCAYFDAFGIDFCSFLRRG